VPSTLLRYFLKRWTWPLLGALVFYGGLLLASDMVRQSKLIFDQGASFQWLIPFLATTLPETLAMVLPMAAVLGGVLGTQALSEGSEMVASQGLGVGMRAILKPWLILSTFLLLLATFNAHMVVPRISTLQTRLEAQMMEETKTRRVRPGAEPWYLNRGPGDDVCVWVAPNNEIHLMESSPAGVQHVIAKSLAWYRDSKSNESPSLILELNDIQGCLVQGGDRVSHLQEKSQRLRIPLPDGPRLLRATPLRYYSTGQLLTLKTPQSLVELCRRITLPLSTAALLLLGIALGFSHPRFHKGGGVIKSLGVILAYYLLLQFLENQLQTGHANALYLLLLMPVLFLGSGLALLARRLRPHRSNGRFLPMLSAFLQTFEWARRVWPCIRDFLGRLKPRPAAQNPASGDARPGILARWTRHLWWRQWGAVMGTFLALDLMMEFAQLAGDISKNNLPYTIFFKYWFFNLPPFLAVVLPVAFLLGSILAFSEAAQSREWVALRAGGTSLVRWMGAGAGAWVLVLGLTVFTDAVLAPAMAGKQDVVYQQIKNRPVRAYQASPWLNLGTTGVLWHLQGDQRWGFPLKTPDRETPILLRWKAGNPQVDALAWDGLNLVQGPPVTSMFPDKALMESGRMEETNTLDLLRWQRWAPDAERATLLWSRLFNWLAGPCLLFTMLPYAFPAPRTGKGRALGLSLVAGLLFLGLQTLFGGAAKSGEIPPIWGVIAPLILLVGFGMLKLNKLRT
jgi:lipopolysaccharide export system permease protein